MKVSATALLVGLGLAALSAPAFAQSAPAPAAGDEDEVVVVTGTRVAARSALDTPAAVDVVGPAQLQNVGTTELNQALSVALPSLNFPRPGLADGTDTIRPAQLRGLAPDQTLVLVNSKRRHSASLVNVNGTVGRGSSAVDMNTIPSAIVQAVEVLRDGASAQYGSDAIAGVINVRLREASEGGGVTLSYGQRVTTVSTLVDVPRTSTGAAAVNPNWSVANLAEYERRDGETFTGSAWAGVPLGDSGFLTVAAEILLQQKTVRTAPDWRQQFALVGGAFDPAEARVNRYNAWYGEPDVTQMTFFANAGYDLDNGVELYGWASYQNRSATSAGFFRRALDDRNTLAIYPNGFLPLINPDVDDLSLAGGARFQWAGWDMDASIVYGSNLMDFTIQNTLNRSQGAASKTQFDAGGFNYNQWVANISGVRQVEIGFASPLNFAWGLEGRREAYGIRAGEPDSYVNGGVLLGSGAPTASGAQVFPGFRPSNEVGVDRQSVAAYVDFEVNLTDAFLVTAAVRAENFTDFGETVTGKVSARWDITDSFALRGSFQNGFRAPSLQQQNFTATSTNFISGVPFDITTFPATSPVAAALGARPLEPEESVNGALGLVARFAGFNLTIDAYQINIDNRIVLSENLTQAAVRTFLTNNGFPGIGGGRFFINGVDTETQGVDIIASYRLVTDAVGSFNFTLGANFNSTEVTRVPTTPQLTGLIPADGLFARVNRLTFERGSPEDKYTFSTDWNFGPFGATVRATRYGEVLSPDANPALDLILEPRTLIDLEGRLEVSENVRISIGADNITDEYPTQTPPNLNTTSNTPFSNLSPFGRSGRYVYGRIAYSW